MQDAGGELSRTTVRLFNELKSQAERAASDQGVSLNTYISRAVSDSVRSAVPNKGGHSGRGPRRPLGPQRHRLHPRLSRTALNSQPRLRTPARTPVQSPHHRLTSTDEDPMHTFLTPEPITLEIRNASGEIRVDLADVATTTVDVVASLVHPFGFLDDVFRAVASKGPSSASTARRSPAAVGPASTGPALTTHAGALDDPAERVRVDLRQARRRGRRGDPDRGHRHRPGRLEVLVHGARHRAHRLGHPDPVAVGGRHHHRPGRSTGDQDRIRRHPGRRGDRPFGGADRQRRHRDRRHRRV